MQTRFPLAILTAAACLAALPARGAEWSWDPMKDVENVLPPEAPNESRIIQGRQQVREMAQDALASLYEIVPGARKAVERSAGYAVFSTFGIKLFFAGGTSGKGVVVNERTHRQTFMKMAQVQAGLGFGASKSRLVFVFTTQQAVRNFINQGWEFGGQANLSAMVSGQGSMFTGAAQVSPGIYLYQLTDTGLAATLTVAGTKFYKDNELN
ncbi:MAG TPA: YSC84-related protein [Burkholderiales bacterium]